MKGLSRFYSSLNLLIVLNVIIKPIWVFGIDRQVQNIVGTESYGVYFSLLGFSIVFSFFLDWGLTTFFNRQLAAGSKEFVEKAGSFIILKLLFSLFYAIIVFLAAYLLNIEQWGILLQIVFIQIITSLFIFLRSIITARQWFKTDTWLSVLDKLLMLLLCGCFLLFPSITGYITIHKFLWIQILCTTLAIVSVIFILYHNKIRISFQAESFINIKLLKAALPFAVIVLLMSVHNRLDGFLLVRLHTNGMYEAGIYAGAYRLLDAANMIGYLVASFLLPFVAYNVNAGKVISDVVLYCRHLLILLAIVIITTSAFFAPWIQQILYHETNRGAVAVLQWCMPALVGYFLIQLYGTVMTAKGQVAQFCIIVLLSVLLNVILNILLIPSLGAKGCSIAALVSQGCCGVATMVYARIKSGINMSFRTHLLYTFITVLLSVYYYCLKRMDVNSSVAITGAVFIVLFISVQLKLIDLQRWKKIMQQNN